jgi:hypothetical protein
MIRLHWKVLYWLIFVAGTFVLTRLNNEPGGSAVRDTAVWVAAIAFYFTWGWLACEYHLLGYDRRQSQPPSGRPGSPAGMPRR